MGKNFLLIVFILFLFAIIVIGGIGIYNDMFNNDKEMYLNSDIYNTEENNSSINVLDSNIELVTTVSEEQKVSPNCIFVFKILYKGCNHLNVEKEFAKESMVNKTREELESIYKEWKIVTFRKDEVLFYKEELGVCKEHYLLKEKDGNIAIYLLDEDDEATLKETTSILTSYLPEEDRQRIKEGIRVNGKEELNRALEDYE